MKLTRDKTQLVSKHGINLWVYPVNRKEAGLVYVKVKEGHFQEFYDKKSTFFYYIIKGKGIFYLNRRPIKAKTADILAIPPRTKIYYFGNMEMILVTTPAWQPENEVHVRFIKKPIKNNENILSERPNRY